MKILIVDGHNAIGAIPEIRAVHERDQEGGRDLISRYLQSLHDEGEFQVVLVFDGQGNKRTKFQARGADMITIFSRSGETADTVIEQLAYKYAGSCDLYVATNDRLEGMLSGASGAWVMSISELERLII